MSFPLFVSCPRYIEELLQRELLELGLQSVRPSLAGVYAEASLSQLYTACVWSRLANRVMLHIGEARVESRDDIYAFVHAQDWSAQFARDVSLAVNFNGGNRQIKNSHYGALLVKDAVVDHFAQSGARPSIDKKQPDIRLHARLAKGKLTLALDLSGDSLHRRGYRSEGSEAPLKENLAAAILRRAEWHTSERQYDALIDPMCGSATLLIEGAMMSTDVAPNLHRQQFGFSRWAQHEDAVWQDVRSAANARCRQGLQMAKAGDIPEFRGYDADPRVIESARNNCHRAGLGEYIDIKCRPLSELGLPTHKAYRSGLLLSNPPYGERLGDLQSLQKLYAQFGERVKAEFGGWRFGILTGNTTLATELRMRSDRKYRFRNGALDTELQLFDILSQENRKHAADQRTPAADATAAGASESKARASKAKVAETLPIDEALANRLRKNIKRVQRELKHRHTNCYRLYDADLPEFASIVEVFGDYVLVTEYAAPASINERVAAERFQLTQSTVATVLNVSPKHLIARRRERQAGKTQYSKRGSGTDLYEVQEGPARLLVNLHDYIDTGLFLDHRPLRHALAGWAKGKHFLNLFCYTGTATVHAALGGARRSTSVDLSATYLAWARQNLALNGGSEAVHAFVQADCRSWLQNCTEKYDVILLDPPSFSNSKRMKGVLDIQRDHVQLIDQCMRCLSANGVLVFSCNLRKFRLDEQLGSQYAVEDFTVKSIDPDFKRSPPPHYCWLIRHN